MGWMGLFCCETEDAAWESDRAELPDRREEMAMVRGIMFSLRRCYSGFIEKKRTIGRNKSRTAELSSDVNGYFRTLGMVEG